MKRSILSHLIWPLMGSAIFFGILLASLTQADNPRGAEDGWYIHVEDVGIGTSWEPVTADTGFTQMAADTAIRVAYAGESFVDSLRGANAGVGTIVAIFLCADSGDETGSVLLKDVGQRDITYKAAAGIFGNGASPQTGYSRVVDDADLRLATGGWAQSVWATGKSAGNPGLGTTQIVWSLYESPDEVRVGFNQLGYPFFVITDDYDTSVDSVSVAVDLYDGTPHLITTRVSANTMRLEVDNRVVVSTVFANASSALTVDTLDIFGIRGAKLFNGYIDEFYLMGDSTTLRSEIHDFLDARGDSIDEARVHIVGIGTDSIRVDTSLTVTMPLAKVTSRRFHAFESAYMDTEEVHPLLIYSSATSPRSSLLDSIPAGKLTYDIGQLMVGKQTAGWMESVEFRHLAATDTSFWELRVYPSIEDTRDLGDGYYVAATSKLHANHPIDRHDLSRAYLPVKGGFIVAYVKGSAATKGAVTLRARKSR